jgi:hypothetical protein
MMENLDLQTYKLLEKFVANGGKLIAFSLPSLVDGSPSEGLKEFLSKYSDKIVTIEKLTPEAISDYLTNQDLTFEGVKGGVLYHHRRKLADGQLLFLVNSSLTDQLYGSLQTKGKDVVEMNTLNGQVYGYPNQQDADKISLSYSIAPAGSLLLYMPEVKNQELKIPEKTQLIDTVPAISAMTVSRNEDNALMIDFCDIEIGGETSKDLHTFNAADKVYKYFGFKNGNPWNTSVQFRTNIVDRDTFGINTGFIATYHFTVNGKFDFSNIKAVVERPGLWTITVNGMEVKPDEGKWWLDRSFAVFSIGMIVKQGDNTIALKTSPMKIHAEIEPVYIVGDFSVKPAEKGWVVESPAKILTTGTWKEQGLPFYSWGITYTKEFNLEKPSGNWEIDPGEWTGTIAEVYVNGKPAPAIAFPPYNSDITPMIQPGMNNVEIKVIGSLKNLLGPHHNNLKPGLVSPGAWRNVKSYPSGKEYQLIDYGLYGEFTLLNRK